MIRKEEKEKVDAKYPFGCKFSMLPPQQQQVANMEVQIKVRESGLNTLAALIASTEANNENGRSDTILTQFRNQYLEDLGEIELLKKEVLSAKNLSSTFEVALKMPDFETPHAGYRYDPTWMDVRHIIKVIGKFNPSTTTDVQFSQFWDKVLLYGKNKFLTEAEYIEILGYVLYGNAMTDWKSMQSRGLGLKEIVNGLTALYDDVETIDDFKYQVDNFVRQKNETISKAMARATNLIGKLAPLHSVAAWPEKSEDMGKSILKQIVNQQTRIELDMEEQKMIRAGASLSLSQMVKIAFDHEKYHKTIPGKEVPTTFQVASMTPSTSQKKDDEKAYLRREASLTKNLDDKLSSFMEQQQQQQHEILQIAAATFKQRGRSLDKFSKDKKSFNRSTSENSNKSSKGALSDGDELMQFDDKPVRADKPKGQVQQQQFKPVYQPKTYEQPWQKKQPQQEQQQPGQKQPYKKQYGNQNQEKRKYPKTMFRPVLYEKDGYHYYQCACTSFHLEGHPCPQTMQINVLQVVDPEDEEQFEEIDQSEN